MNYSDRIKFVTKTEGGFNPETGNHEPPSIESVKKPCNITTLGSDRSNQLFGTIDTNVIVVRLQQPYNEQFSYAEVKEGHHAGKYHKNSVINHRRKTVYYLEETK